MEDLKPAVIEALTIPDILNSFKIYDGTYKRREIDAAILLKDEITPHLIKILENVLANPGSYIEDDSLNDHIYSVMLLGHFKVLAAHQVIVDLFSLSDDIPEQLFGDIKTENLPVILLNTCGGDVKSIKAMVLDKSANDYCRVSACQALAYAVVTGYAAREDVLTFFNTLFSGDETDKFSDFWGLIANIICDLYPEENMDAIRQGYEAGLISSGSISYRAFEQALNLGKEKCLEELENNLRQDSLDDIHASMSWWSCFNGDAEPEFPSSVIENGVLSGYSQKSSTKSQKKNKNKKKKRKQAKASKKKNRR